MTTLTSVSNASECRPSHPQAFSGNLRELVIKKSRFDTIQEEAFDIRVSNMEFTKSVVKELRSKGLSVLARESIWLERVRIELLRTNAFAALRTEQGKEDLDPMLTIRKLELIKSENGSLTFSECTKVRLTDLDLVTPWPRICPTEKWAQALSGGGVKGQLYPAQYQLFFQLFRRRMCLEDSWTKFPTSVDNPHCEVNNPGNVIVQTGSDAGLDDPKHTDASNEDVSGKDNTAEEDSSRGENTAQDENAGNDAAQEKDDNIVNAEERQLPKGPGGLAGASSASRASHAGRPASEDAARDAREDAARVTREAVATDAPGAQKPHAENEVAEDTGPHMSKGSVVDIVVVDVEVPGGELEMTLSAREARRTPASDESKEPSSSESEEPLSAIRSSLRSQTQEQENDGNDDDNKVIHNAPVEKIHDSEPGAEPSDSSNDMGVHTHPSDTRALPSSEGPSSTSNSSVTAHWPASAADLSGAGCCADPEHSAGYCSAGDAAERASQSSPSASGRRLPALLDDLNAWSTGRDGRHWPGLEGGLRRGGYTKHNGLVQTLVGSLGPNITTMSPSERSLFDRPVRRVGTRVYRQSRIKGSWWYYMAMICEKTISGKIFSKKCVFDQHQRSKEVKFPTKLTLAPLGSG